MIARQQITDVRIAVHAKIIDDPFQPIVFSNFNDDFSILPGFSHNENVTLYGNFRPFNTATGKFDNNFFAVSCHKNGSIDTEAGILFRQAWVAFGSSHIFTDGFACSHPEVT